MALKLKTRAQFPAVVTATSPIILTKNGVSYSFTFDESGFQALLNPFYAQLINNLSDIAFKYTALDNLSIHGADIASAATINLETSTGDLVDVTGTVTITAITLNEGHERTVRFTGILTLTNGASLVIPGGTRTTAAGDFAVFRGYAAGAVRCVEYTPATGKATISPAVTDVTGLGTGVAAFLATPSSANLITALTDETGTGSAVFSVSPALTGTPTAPTAAAGTNTTQLATTAGIVAERAATKTLTNTTLDSAGTGNSFQVGSVALSKGQFPGETTTGSATAGNVGEVISSSVASGSAIGITSGAPINITSISLTAGDWDVSANISFGPAATTNVTLLLASISQTTGTSDLTTLGASNQQRSAGFVPGAGGTMNCLVGPMRISLSGTTTIFLVTQANFTVATLSGYGILRARRAR